MRHPPPFNLLLASADGFVPPAALGGLPDSVLRALHKLGFPARIAVNEFVRDATNIVFAAHNLDASLVATLPPGTIVYNAEMVVPGSPFVAAMLPFVRTFETWDYSATNVRRWREMGLGDRVRHVRPGYMSHITSVDLDAPRDIDVLFYGHASPRRDAALRAIESLGVGLRALDGVYGAELHAVMARTRIVLNVHYGDAAVFEFARLSGALANRRCFVTEAGGEEDVDPALRPGFVSVPYERLAETCRALVDDVARREAIAQRGFDLYRATDYTRNLAEALGLPARA